MLWWRQRELALTADLCPDLFVALGENEQAHYNCHSRHGGVVVNWDNTREARRLEKWFRAEMTSEIWLGWTGEIWGDAGIYHALDGALPLSCPSEAGLGRLPSNRRLFTRHLMSAKSSVRACQGTNLVSSRCGMERGPSPSLCGGLGKRSRCSATATPRHTPVLTGCCMSCALCAACR